MREALDTSATRTTTGRELLQQLLGEAGQVVGYEVGRGVDREVAAMGDAGEHQAEAAADCVVGQVSEADLAVAGRALEDGAQAAWALPPDGISAS